MAEHKFTSEVNDLLHLIIHSLYSNQEIFVRELVSNASDALDKLKFMRLTEAALKDDNFDPRIDIAFDEAAGTLSISDSGIGLNEAELIENIGTIARSGTRRFVEQLSGDNKKDANLVGQFGVGFYSAFMVADEIEILTRRAGETKALRWTSDGKTGYSIEPAERDQVGTTVQLKLNEEGKGFASRWRLENLIKKYSNHIPFAIFLHYDESRWEGEGDDAKEIKEPKVEQINAGSALWKRPKASLSEQDYFDFYKSLSYDSQEPLLYSHSQVEGGLDYTTLFFVPKTAPQDLFRVDYQPGVKLYIKRVFITDDDKELLPTYLRFVRGVIDSEDLPLNVSREILQQNRVLDKIRTAAVKKLLDEFASLSEDKTRYADFIKEFGRPLKEGLYQDYVNRDKLLDLVRFKSTHDDNLVSLAEYKTRMQAEQKSIYYVTGQDAEQLRHSPLLELYRSKDIEVLLLDDEIDEIVMPSIDRYQDIPFKAVNRSDAAEDLKTDDDKAKEKELAPLMERIKEALGDAVKEVKASTRLSESPSCVVVDSNDPTLQMQGLLKSLGQGDVPMSKPILEINPEHGIVQHLQKVEEPELFGDMSQLLLDQALLIEGLQLKDPGAFVKRLNKMMARVEN